MTANNNVRNKQFTTSDIRLAINDVLQKSIRDELDDYPENYRYLIYEDWCDLLSTFEVKYESKIESVHIKNILYARAASLSDSDKSVRIPR